MKILLILNPIDETKPAGLGRSVYNFAYGLIEKRLNDDFVLFTKYPINQKKLFPNSKNIISAINTDGKSIWWSRKISSREFDLVVTFTPAVPVWFFHKKIITFVHDFAYLSFGSFLNRCSLWLAHQLTFIKSKGVIAVSKETKKILLKNFIVYRNVEVQVIYNGFDHFKKITIESKKRFASPFFLSVGVLKERKNTLNTIIAFSKFLKYNNDFSLIIIGNSKTKYGDLLKRKVCELNIESKVSFLDFVDDTTLASAYCDASGLIFPSLVEGFGFPVLEAMAYGAPVVTSKGGALEEVAGQAAILVNPNDLNDIVHSMQEVISKEKRKKLIELGYENVKRFHWNDSCSNLSAFIDQINNK